MQCIGCVYLGYFIEEKSRDGGTINFTPRTLPQEGRDRLHDGSEQAFQGVLLRLRAQHNRIACLIEVGDGRGGRRSLEPRFEAASRMDEIRAIASGERICRSYCPHDTLLSLEDSESLRRRDRADALATAIETRRRVERNTQSLELFSSLLAEGEMTRAQRGKRFERWIGDVLTTSRVRYALDVINNYEQIDFTVWIGEVDPEIRTRG